VAAFQVFRRGRIWVFANNEVEPASIPRLCKEVSYKTIENILINPFYIGKLKVPGGGRTAEDWIDGIHPPLISASTFQRVQAVLRQRNVSVHYPHLAFYLFRGMLRCRCGRFYSPYVKKGITYYRTRCKPGCTNHRVNVNEKKVDQRVVELLRGIALTPDELRELEIEGNLALNEVSSQREVALASLSREHQKLRADLEFLTRERWTLLRTGVVQADAMRSEEERLVRAIADVEKRMMPYEVPLKDLIEEVVSYTELIRSVPGLYERGLDVDKHALLSMVFTELILDDEALKYRAKDGFDVLLARNDWENGNSAPRVSVKPNFLKRRRRHQNIIAHLDEYHTALKSVSSEIKKVQGKRVQCNDDRRAA
jgi:site-specific DNA recombinase